jgi:WD40 repeat protein
MFVGYSDGAVKAWDVLSDRPDPVFSLSEHTGNVAALALNFSGNALCTGSTDHSIKVYL